jgi:uncharacterized protein
MTLNIPFILHAVLEEYNLPLCGHHGVTHWARVLKNGLRLAKETEATQDYTSTPVQRFVPSTYFLMLIA